MEPNKKKSGRKNPFRLQIANIWYVIFGGCSLSSSLLALYFGGRQSQQSFLLLLQRKYSLEDAPHGPKDAVSE
jgi:hypothetical protein